MIEGEWKRISMDSLQDDSDDDGLTVGNLLNAGGNVLMGGMFGVGWLAVRGVQAWVGGRNSEAEYYNLTSGSGTVTPGNSDFEQ